MTCVQALFSPYFMLWHPSNHDTPVTMTLCTSHKLPNGMTHTCACAYTRTCMHTPHTISMSLMRAYNDSTQSPHSICNKFLTKRWTGSLTCIPLMRTPSDWEVERAHLSSNVAFFSSLASSPYCRVPILRSRMQGHDMVLVRLSNTM